MAFRQYEGTIKPAPNFDPESAADELEKAMKGSGCDKNKVIEVIAKISNAQRQMVSELWIGFYYPLFCCGIYLRKSQVLQPMKRRRDGGKGEVHRVWVANSI